MSRKLTLQQLASADSVLDAEITSMLTALNATKMAADDMCKLLLDVDNFWEQQSTCVDLYYQNLVSSQIFQCCQQISR